MYWIVYAMLFVNTVNTKTLVFVALTYSTYISVHNFLNIQTIFNLKKSFGKLRIRAFQLYQQYWHA